MAVKLININALSRFWTDVKSYLSSNYGFASTGGTLNITVGSGKNYATIQAALDSLPKNIGDMAINIVVDAGTFAEDVNVSDFTGSGGISITGAGAVGVPTTIIKSIYCNNVNVMLYLNNLSCNNSRIWSGTDTYSVGFNNCRAVYLSNLRITATVNWGFVIANSVVFNAEYCITEAGVGISVRVRYNGFFYALSSCNWTASAQYVRCDFGGRYMSSVLVEQSKMYDEYGGMVITDGGMSGLVYKFTTTNTYCTNTLVLRFYPHLRMCIISGTITVKSGQTVAANTNVTVANTGTAPAEALPNDTRALAAFQTVNTEIKAYISNGGNIGVRAGTAIAAGTSFMISGAYLIGDAQVV